MSGPGHSPARIVLFSGGTACRTINLELSRRGHSLTRVVPAWDSGGSSKVLREAFGMLPVGDIRQALMTMAHGEGAHRREPVGEGRAGDIVKICNSRLSGDFALSDLRLEFDFYAMGRHRQIERMPSPVRQAILGYLEVFRDRISPDFDLRNGSIGNFILTGAYFANDRNIVAAISEFRRLCGIDGNVWPVSDADDVQLDGRLNDGTAIRQQHRLTSLNAQDAQAGIASVVLVRADGAGIPACSEAIDAIRQADLIAFGPGSFFTSILPHLQVDGVAEAIVANTGALKLFIGNILECRETQGVTVEAMMEDFLAAFPSGGASPALTHALINRELFPFPKKVGEFAYLRAGNIERTCTESGITLSVRDFEDAWTRGQHDGAIVAEAIERTLAP